MHLPNWAGHDAQMMAKLTPMGMIFVPGVAGISHSPKELTSWKDCANGANVLLETVLAMAGQGKVWGGRLKALCRIGPRCFWLRDRRWVERVS